MPKRGVVTQKHAAERLALIRHENVKRHNEFAAKTKLKNDRIHAQRIATMQMELDRLHGAATRGSGLDATRINRMKHLRQIIVGVALRPPVFVSTASWELSRSPRMAPFAPSAVS